VVNVPLTSIDKLVAQLQLPRVDFIKMDIKGATAKALIGAKGLLASGPSARSLNGGARGQSRRHSVGGIVSAALLSDGVRTLFWSAS